tara:strand:+ start:122 stop:700 length:579 start_codon:yes stop_codon:yes gene_type:complete
MPSSHSIKKILENIGEGFFSKKKIPTANQFEISENDPSDVIFAKNLNNSGGKFFYCKNEKKIKTTLDKLLSHLKISHLYCIDEKIQKKLHDLNISFESSNEDECQGVITSCEHIIADQGKVLLSSKQIKNKKPSNFPNELIIISYTSQIVLRINDAMRAITKKYSKKTPSNITTIGNGMKNLNVIIIEDFKS